MKSEFPAASCFGQQTRKMSDELMPIRHRPSHNKRSMKYKEPLNVPTEIKGCTRKFPETYKDLILTVMKSTLSSLTQIKKGEEERGGQMTSGSASF